MYIYESHMGYLYTSSTPLTYEQIHCEQCGETDWLIGYAATRAEAWDLLKDETNTFDISMCEGCPHLEDEDYCECECEYFAQQGGWNYDHVQELISENWSK